MKSQNLWVYFLFCGGGRGILIKNNKFNLSMGKYLI